MRFNDESEQARQRRGRRIGLVAVLAIALVDTTAARSRSTPAWRWRRPSIRVRGACWSIAAAAKP
jgi:hypothetical protein